MNFHEVAFTYAQAFRTPARPSLSGFLTGAGAVFHNFAMIFPARCVLSELLLFQDLQTFVSVVAFAREYPRYASRHTGFTAATMLAVS